MSINSTQIKTVSRLIRVCLGVFVFSTGHAWAAEENCNSWSAPAIDPGKGRYILELRTCDLTYGLSAYAEIKNMSDKRLALTYRILTGDDKYKDGDIVLEPGVITRAGNCQACAKRHAGYKSWEIVSVEIAPEADAGEATVSPSAKPAALPAFMDKPAETKKPVAEVPVSPTPARPVAEPIAEKPAAPAAAIPAPPAVAAPVVEKPKPAEQPKTEGAVPAAESEKKEDGFRADDGTIIPWDQMPPEFRPRK